jgi:hypothetical protein
MTRAQPPRASSAGSWSLASEVPAPCKAAQIVPQQQRHPGSIQLPRLLRHASCGRLALMTALPDEGSYDVSVRHNRLRATGG